ncbi:hypothetical protein TNCV_390391 [Trichonephila clavipes]|nr:hypothetical protein TNCV_390391 [Trichonephila clavipes]
MDTDPSAPGGNRLQMLRAVEKRVSNSQLIAFLSLIGTQTVPGKLPSSEFHRTLRSLYRFSSIAEGTSQPLPQKSIFTDSLAPLISSFSYHPLPNHPSVIACSSATPVGLGSLDLLFFCHPCRSQPT